jgi:hypothetical protein
MFDTGKILNAICFAFANVLVWTGIIFIVITWYRKIIEFGNIGIIDIFMFVIMFVLSLPLYIIGSFSQDLASVRDFYWHLLASTGHRGDTIHILGKFICRLDAISTLQLGRSLTSIDNGSYGDSEFN